MIDTTSEKLIPVGKAKIPGNPSIKTRWRWLSKGVRGVVLETVVVGWQRYTSAEAVARFLAALNSPGAVPDPSRPAAEIANSKLMAMGV